jgi:hypothetical protein
LLAVTSLHVVGGTVGAGLALAGAIKADCVGISTCKRNKAMHHLSCLQTQNQHMCTDKCLPFPSTHPHSATQKEIPAYKATCQQAIPEDGTGTMSDAAISPSWVKTEKLEA